MKGINTVFRITLAVVFGMVLLIGGCQSAEDDGSEDMNAQAKDKEDAAEKEKEKSEPQLETGEVTSRAWKDTGGKIQANGAAVIKNTGNVPVEFDSVHLRFEGQDQELIGKKEVLNVVPKIIRPGESAYIGGTIRLKKAGDPEDLEKVTLDTDYYPALKKPDSLKTDQVKGKRSKNGVYTVTGEVENPTEKEARDIFLVAALKDQDGKLLGVVNEYLNTKIASGERKEFEVKNSDLPEGLTKKIDEVGVQAYPLFTEKEPKEPKKKDDEE
ncbi:FxLYD domain-containing protein [Paludifilum halophilum]|uniref:Lipoprotein n=1 Tax=Paludifilum halophilum TaxID=1642702 RepID=A0A235B5G4_9BACL|nr:FxLYD domain-containing protein [Paludifilum halophilum]OYD07471.1 hypothetical protein CHM34_11255 [Paludifilum halophilum]